MSLRIKIECLREPDLLFGHNLIGVEPRRMMAKAGAVDSAGGKELSVGLVGPSEDILIARAWLPRLNTVAIAREKSAKRYRDWPGAQKTLGVTFVVDDRFVRALDTERLALALNRTSPSDKFEELLDLFDAKIQGLFGDVRPDCIVVCLPEQIADLRISNPRLSLTERAALERLQREEEQQQMALFQPTPEELKAAAELRTQAEDLLFRTFYRALKARIMTHQNPVPVQVVRRETFLRPDDDGHSFATRLWNLATSLFYKAGHEPWRPADLPGNTCFIGLSFHHLKRREGDVVYASVAQAFSNEIEPFALKGSTLPHDQRRDRQPYLNEDQAASLMKDVLDKYEGLAGVLPARVVVHKTSLYQPEEEKGFRQAAEARVPVSDLIWMRSTAFRLIRKGTQEPWRGTLCTLGDESYLFTSGYVPWWDEYPGPHIPAPLEIGSRGSTDIRQRAKEILALTKMNWNSTEGIGRHPITISFARKVGTLMTELSDNQTPNPSYRFYM
ncbi:MAG: argonaute/piwi family protein [Candidatus Acidiferrales bacterium]